MLILLGILLVISYLVCLPLYFMDVLTGKVAIFIISVCSIIWIIVLWVDSRGGSL